MIDFIIIDLDREYYRTYGNVLPIAGNIYLQFLAFCFFKCIAVFIADYSFTNERKNGLRHQQLKYIINWKAIMLPWSPRGHLFYFMTEQTLR